MEIIFHIINNEQMVPYIKSIHLTIVIWIKSKNYKITKFITNYCT
jgi:hypothetical protein